MNIIIKLLLAILMCSLVFDSTKLVAASQGGNISGTVLDGAGLPLQNVTVAIKSYSGSYNATATSDLSGNYRFSALTSGLYTIHFAKTGYLTRWNGGATSQDTALPIILNDADSIANINSRLPQGGGISGTVKDATGAPISNASVFATQLLGGGPTYSATTDASGNYAITGMESGTYYIDYFASNFQAVWYGGTLNRMASTAVKVRAPDITTGINGQLGIGGSISGSVTDSAQNPLSNIYVSLHGPSISEFDVTSTYTDASGNYTFTGIGNGTYYIQADFLAWYGGATYGTAIPITISSPDDVFSGKNIAIDLGHGMISGKVTDVNNVPISGASLALYDSTGEAVSYASGGSTSSDGNGSFSFDKLKTGDYYIKCFSMGTPETWYGGVQSLQTATTITVTSPNTVSGVIIKMGIGSSVSGTVTDAQGSPAGGINVNLYDLSGNTPVGGSVTTDSSGNYVFRGFPIGTYYIRFNPPSASYGPPVWYGGGKSQQSAVPVTIAGPSPVTGINAQIGGGARISGTVRGPLNLPVPWATVALFDQMGNRIYSVDSDTVGAYQFAGLPAGMYFIQFIKAGISSSWYGNASSQLSATPIALTSSSVVSGVDGLLPLGGRISGTVVDAASAPLPSVNVILYRADGNSVANSWTDSSGNYSLAGIADGQYYVRFSSTGMQTQWYGGTSFMQASTPITLAGSSYVSGIDAQMGVGGSISGRISRGTSFMIIRLYDVAGKLVASTRIVDSSGNYFFTGLQTGTYYLQITQMLANGAVWYGGLTFQAATPIQVTAPQAVNDIDFSFDVTGVNWIDCYIATNGTITGSPAGVLCSKEITSGCSVAYASNETVTLTATPDASSYFAGWGGDCQGTSTCTVDMNTSHFVSALFQSAPTAKINDTGYLTLSMAYSAAGPVATIKALDTVLAEDFILSDNKVITIQGGYNAQYTSRSDVPTVLTGSLIIGGGQLIVDGLTISSN